MIPAGDELARAAWAQAWQVTTLIVVVAVLTRFLARNRPHLAHALWLVVLLKCVTPPVWSSTSGVFCWMQFRSSEDRAEVVPTPSLPAEGDTTAELGSLSPTARVESNPLTTYVRSDCEVAVRPSEFDGRPDCGRPEIGSKLSGGSRKGIVTATLMGGWLLGTFAVLGLGAVRSLGGLKRIRRSGCRNDRSYDRLTASLSRRLGLWRPARLAITKSLVGPAVVGLFRPTVLLPEIVVRGKTAEDLEPILAHELIHIRRGDLWIGMLQTIAQAVWWFHPLLWWAGQLVSREAERCCDEAVVAELGCKPARYARCLFDVLKRKQDLKPLPAFPGVRPVEVTSRRMERIMRLGQGSRKRSPWWCWVVLVLAAVVTLPGAALVLGAADRPAPERGDNAETLDVPSPGPVGEDLSAAKELPALPNGAYRHLCGGDSPTATDATADGGEPLASRAYPLDDLLAMLESEYGLNEKEAKEFLLSSLGAPAAVPEGDGSKRRLEWSGKALLVRDETCRGHARIVGTLRTMRACGFRAVQIEACFATCPAKMVDTLDVRWKLMPTAVSAAETPQEALPPVPAVMQRAFPVGDAGADRGRAEVIVEKSLPVTSAVLDEGQRKAVLERLQNDRPSNILHAPVIRVFSGQSACISDTSQSPFVVGMREGKPQIRVISEGTSVRLRPLLGKRDSLRLDYELSISKIRGVETAPVTGGPNGETATLQVPEVQTTRVKGSAEFPAGHALLIGGLPSTDPDRPSMLVMLHAVVVQPARPLREAELYTRAYPVADLVVPLPYDTVLSAGPIETKERPKPSSPDFDSLIDLITSTIAPAKWDKVGGRGSIAPFETNLSLVVSQTQEVHEEIVDLLEQLRRMQDLQIMLDAEIVHMPREMVQRIGIDFAPRKEHTTLGPREARMFRAFVEGSNTGGIRPVARMMLFNGQVGEVPARFKARGRSAAEPLRIMPVVSQDRRSVRLTLADRKDASNASPDGTTVVVGDGRTLLLDVTGRLHRTDRAVGAPIAPGSRIFRRIPNEASTEKTFLLVTPRIVVVEEEEERVATSRR